MAEIRVLWLMDYNGTYALDRGVLPEDKKATIAGKPLSVQSYQLLKREVPDIPAWEKARPLCGIADDLNYASNLILQTIIDAEGVDLQARPFKSPFSAWTNLAPYLGYDERTLDEIFYYYDRLRREDSFMRQLQRRRQAEEDNNRHINPYQIIPTEQDGLIQRTARGDVFTFASALLGYSEQDWIRQMDKSGTWQFIKSNNPPGWLREGEGHADVDIIEYKCTVYTLMNKVVSTLNLQNIRKGVDTRWVLKGMDDHWRFVRTVLALIDDLEMHLPISEEDAEAQGEVNLIEPLVNKITNSEAVFNSHLAL